MHLPETKSTKTYISEPSYITLKSYNYYNLTQINVTKINQEFVITTIKNSPIHTMIQTKLYLNLNSIPS